MPAYEFDANEVQPSTGFDAIPAGKYKVVIEKTEEKPTKKQDGHYLQFTFSVIEGQYEGRKLFARLNLDNPSDQAVGIARAELSAICRAAGKMKFRDTEELHDLPLIVRVIAKPDAQSGEVRNEIKGYESTSGAVTPPAGKSVMAGPSAVAGAGAAPWKRGK